MSRVRIYTRTGDAGETGLFAGGRVAKDHPRVAACGDVDELNSAIGLAASFDPADFEDALLASVQRDLFTMGAQLATPDPAALAKALGNRRLDADHVAALERAIDRLEQELPPLRQFVLPGATPKAAAFHVARAVCRRAERSVVRLTRGEAAPPAALAYLNRLSDLLFVLARAANARAGKPDATW